MNDIVDIVDMNDIVDIKNIIYCHYFFFVYSAFELLDHPKELARQITLIDHSKQVIFMSIIIAMY